MVEKIVVVIMGQDCEKFIGMCLDSVKDADAIVYCDGGSTDETLKILGMHKYPPSCCGIYPKCSMGTGKLVCKGIKENKKINIIQNNYDQKDKGMNGKQRNFYLDYIKKNYPGWFCLVLDADEVVEDFVKIKNFINILPQDQHDVLWSVKMRHFVGDLGHEDATVPIHHVQHRLFKIRDDLHYPEVEHPILQTSNKTLSGLIQPTTIWHLSYLSGCFDILKKYNNHLKKSNIHSEEYLDDWKDSHILGLYPKKQIDIQEIPDIILQEFNINKDKWYFRNRGLEVKHFIDVYNWKQYFKLGEENA